MIRRLLLLVVALTILATTAPQSAAALTTSWQKELGVSLTSVAVGAHGSIYVAGSQANGKFQTKSFLAKLSPTGTVLWTRTWLPSNKINPATHTPWYSARATAVAVATDGTIVVTGFVEKINCEGGGWFIRKYGPSGKTLHSFGRFQKRRLQQCTLAPQSTSAIAVRGNLVVVAGQDFGCCDDPASDGWVRAFDGRLRPRWEAPFEPPTTIPQPWYDTAEGISLGAGGNVYVGGWASTEPPASGFDTFSGVGAVVLEKLDATGSLAWSHTTGATMFRGSGPVSVSVRGDRAMVSAPVDGTGIRWTASQRTHAWLGRFTLDGALVWSREWGLSKKHAAAPTGISVDASMSTWVVGTQRDPTDHGLNVFVRRFGPGGKQLGQRSIGGGVSRTEGGGIAARAAAAYATGTTVAPSTGRVWRVAA